MKAIYGLCDVNNFYVSCERSFRPDLENKPVIVLSNNDGCAVARSNEVKNLGIKMGAPLHLIQKEVTEHDIQVFSSNYALYGDMSHRFASIVEEYTNQVEIYSIDELFIGFNGFKHYNLTHHSQKLVKAVRRSLGLPICIGLAPSKTLAKVANHYAKWLGVDGGVISLDTEYKIQNALKHLPVNEIWGIGRKLSKRLNSHGIKTALNLRDAEISTLRRHYSVNMERTIRELRGEPCYGLKEQPAPKKQIVCTRSFANKTSDYETVKKAIAYHVTRGCENLRKQSSMARAIHVGIRTNPFSKGDAQYVNSMVMKLPEYTNNTSVFLKAANTALKRLFRERFLYKKCGIMLLDLTQGQVQQPDLFHHVNQNPKLMKLVDSMNHKYGKSTVRFGSEGFDKQWVMRSERKSPAYTTRWDDILKVA